MKADGSALDLKRGKCFRDQRVACVLSVLNLLKQLHLFQDGVATMSKYIYS